jgi:hypothetical protein
VPLARGLYLISGAAADMGTGAPSFGLILTEPGLGPTLSGIVATSPTQRTLRECRRRGWTACVVERWIAQARQRVDAFGFGDVLAVDPAGEGGAILLQATSGSNVAARVSKILDLDTTHAWLAAGNRVAVWGWAKRGPRGQRKVWTVREVEITLGRFGRLQAEEQAA